MCTFVRVYVSHTHTHTHTHANRVIERRQPESERAGERAAIGTVVGAGNGWVDGRRGGDRGKCGVHIRPCIA